MNYSNNFYNEVLLHPEGRQQELSEIETRTFVDAYFKSDPIGISFCVHLNNSSEEVSKSIVDLILEFQTFNLLIKDKRIGTEVVVRSIPEVKSHFDARLLENYSFFSQEPGELYKDTFCKLYNQSNALIKVFISGTISYSPLELAYLIVEFLTEDKSSHTASNLFICTERYFQKKQIQEEES